MRKPMETMRARSRKKQSWATTDPRLDDIAREGQVEKLFRVRAAYFDRQFARMAQDRLAAEPAVERAGLNEGRSAATEIFDAAVFDRSGRLRINAAPSRRPRHTLRLAEP